MKTNTSQAKNRRKITLLSEIMVMGLVWMFSDNSIGGLDGAVYVDDTKARAPPIATRWSAWSDNG
jgi:hypothetical protein